MLNKTISSLFFLFISFNLAADSISEKTSKLLNGDGWRVVRSVELGKTGNLFIWY